jgi:hypothetical protein
MMARKVVCERMWRKMMMNFFLSGELRPAERHQEAWTKLNAYNIAVESSGNAYLTGWASGSLDGNLDAGWWDMFLIKYDPSGVKQ